jgi:hypothetical protein
VFRNTKTHGSTLSPNQDVVDFLPMPEAWAARVISLSPLLGFRQKNK